MDVEWDETKRRSNLAKHGLDLMTGAALFDRRPVLSYPAARSGEERFVTVGLLEGEIVAVIWARRVGAIRLISLRRARDAEKRAYRTHFG